MLQCESLELHISWANLMILVLVQLDTSKVESGDVTGYLRFLNRGNYCTVGDGLVIMMIREECKRAVGGARTKPGATAKQVERILSLLAIALIIPHREHKEWQLSLAPHT